MSNISEISGFIWTIADSVLRGPYKRNEYQKVILPFTVLKRFDSVLEFSKNDVIETYEENKDKTQFIDPLLKSVAVNEDGKELGFYNYSPFDFNKLLEDPDNIEENLIFYLNSFSDNVKDILENFDIENEVANLSKSNILYLLVKKFAQSTIDLSPKNLSNHDMGTIFEELIRKFSETSNEEAGQHFTPRDVVKLMTELLLINEELDDGTIKQVYDPACGTGGMLTSCEEFITSKNPNTKVVLYGQEIQKEIYAICKSDMLIKGEDADNIKGPFSTLSDDKLKDKQFHYMISNPPYGRDWEQDKPVVDEEVERGYEGRFGAGTPRKNDGQLLFIQHMISKMKSLPEKSRIAVITNEAPLFTGDANSGESNIRKWMLDNDYIETIIGLPNQLFFNTGIGTYIWILTNQKSNERKEKVQLIDATEQFAPMRKSLGNKRHYITEDNMTNILNDYKEFTTKENVMIFDKNDFGYTKITVERPLQLNYHISPERLENLYSYKPFRDLAISKNKNPEIKMNEEEQGKLKQEEIKNALQNLPDQVFKNWDQFKKLVVKELEPFNLKDTFIDNIIKKISEHDETADYVTTKSGKVLMDPNLKDYEKIPFNEDIDKYFQEEVLKYYPDAQYDPKNNQIGYEINFREYFYIYEPPREISQVETDISDLISKLQKSLNEFDTKEYFSYPKYNEFESNLLSTIPTDWSTYKLKFLFSKLESGKRKDFEFEDYAFSIGGEHINWDGTLNLKNKRYLSEDFYNSRNKGKIKENDVLLVKDGATIGKTAFVDNLPMKMAVNEHVFIIRHNNLINPKLLYYLISSNIGFSQIKLTETGSAQGGINLSIGDRVLFSIPNNISEQNKMVEYLDYELSKITSNISMCKELIELLEEMKTSLVNEVVTGAIDVRGDSDE